MLEVCERSTNARTILLQIDIVALYLLTLSQMITSGLEVGKMIQWEDGMGLGQ